MHDYLKEIYFDYCLKNDMPKHPESAPHKGYLSADDLLCSNYQLTKNQVSWLKNYIRLWNIIEDTWLEEDKNPIYYRKG